MSEMPNSLDIPVETAWNTAQQSYDFDNYGFAEIDRDDEFDPLASISAGETLAENLLQQLEEVIPPGDEPIAEQLVGNLNERGHLDISVAEIAERLRVPVERARGVRGASISWKGRREANGASSTASSSIATIRSPRRTSSATKSPSRFWPIVLVV